MLRFVGLCRGRRINVTGVRLLSEEPLLSERQFLPPGHVGLKMDASVVGVYDLRAILERYGTVPARVGSGFTGTGVVNVVATDVTSVSKGDRVFVVSEGTWTPTLTLPIEQVTSTPGLSATHAASLSYFASAWGLLHNFTSLQAGDIVVQTHSNTAVGKAITQLGNALGLNVISLTETEALPANLSKKLSEVTGYKLAITGQAGRHISTLQRFVPTTVLYTGLYVPASRILNVELPIGHMVFSGASLHGFDARTWSRSNPADYLAAVRHVVRLAEQKKVDLTPAVVVSKEQLNQAVAEVARTGTSVVLEGL